MFWLLHYLVGLCTYKKKKTKHVAMHKGFLMLFSVIYMSDCCINFNYTKLYTIYVTTRGSILNSTENNTKCGHEIVTTLALKNENVKSICFYFERNDFRLSQVLF